METSIIIAVLSSSVLTSLITSIVTKLIRDKSNKLKYVTEERQKWREEIRKAAVDLRRIGSYDKGKGFNSIEEAKTYFQVRLNPYDEEDKELLKLICKGENGMIPAENLDELSDAISYLLKHDWERVKQEASSTGLARIYYKLLALLVIASLPYTSYKLLNPLLNAIINILGRNITPISLTSTLCLLVFLFWLLLVTRLVILTVPMLLIGLDSLWRELKNRLSTSDAALDKFVRDSLNLPYRQSIVRKRKSREKHD